MIEELIRELKNTDRELEKYDDYDDFDNSDRSECIGYRDGLEFALNLLGVKVERDLMGRCRIIIKVEI